MGRDTQLQQLSVSQIISHIIEQVRFNSIDIVNNVYDELDACVYELDACVCVRARVHMRACMLPCRK